MGKEKQKLEDQLIEAGKMSINKQDQNV